MYQKILIFIIVGEFLALLNLELCGCFIDKILLKCIDMCIFAESYYCKFLIKRNRINKYSLKKGIYSICWFFASYAPLLNYIFPAIHDVLHCQVDRGQGMWAWPFFLSLFNCTSTYCIRLSSVFTSPEPSTLPLVLTFHLQVHRFAEF